MFALESASGVCLELKVDYSSSLCRSCFGGEEVLPAVLTACSSCASEA